ncbi:MAG: mechanosensitive ion channel [bacterium]|nr:mechanosensitive ion channel [bacterium]
MIEKIVNAFRDLADSVVAALPKVAIGIVMIVVALIAAKLVEKILRVILVRIRFDSIVERVGVDKMLQRVGIRQQLNQSLPRLVYFLLLLLFARTAADALELTAISGALGSLFAYLPNLVAALLVVMIGTAAGQFAGNMVTQAASESGIDFAPALGRVVSTLIFFVVGVMAVTQLKVDTEIIRIVATIVLTGMALAFGLSFGLGSRELTRNIIAGFYARRVLSIGEPIEVAGERGVLESITPTHARIRSEDRTVTLANARLLDEVARQ